MVELPWFFTKNGEEQECLLMYAKIASNVVVYRLSSFTSRLSATR